jgi:hypothetical protein
MVSQSGLQRVYDLSVVNLNRMSTGLGISRTYDSFSLFGVKDLNILGTGKRGQLIALCGSSELAVTEKGPSRVSLLQSGANELADLVVGRDHQPGG